MGFLFNFFLNPTFLVATASAGVPVIIHLIHRRRSPRVFFSTLRFLRISVERTARRRRIEDLLLLVLRSLLFFLLAVALAKPFLRAGGAFGGGAETAVAIVLDNSASMGMLHQGRRRFARAKEAALAIISPRNLRSGRDACCFIPTNGPLAQAQPLLLSDLERVEAMINECDLSAGFADLTAAIQRAVEVLARSGKPNRELYVITDMQANSWRGIEQSRVLLEHPDIPLVVIDCSGRDYEDLAVASLRLESQGLVAGLPLSIRATIFNPSPRTVKRYVSLYINRTRVNNTDSPVLVPPGGTAEVAFSYTFGAAGRYAGWVRIDEDSLDLDNQRHFVVSVADRIPVLLIRDEENPVPYLDEAFFLRAALNPYSLLDAAAKWAIQPQTELARNISPELLHDYRVVFLLNCRDLTAAAAEALSGYVRRGGGLVIGLGSAVRADIYNRLFGEGGGGLLPALLSGPVGGSRTGVSTTSASSSRHPQRADLKHFLIRPFAKYPSLYQRILVRRYFRLVRPLPSRAEVVVWLDSGDPLVLETRVGQGRVVLITTTLNDAWTNLPASKFYPIFVQRLVFYLTGSGGEWGGRNYTVGTAVHIPLPGADRSVPIDLTTPDDQTLRLRSAPGDGGVQVVVFSGTHRPGIYTYQSPERPDLRGAFAVNFDPAEADLRLTNWRVLRGRLPVRRALHATDIAQLFQRIATLREGVQLWNFFLFAVLVLAMVECFVANRPTTRRVDGAPRPPLFSPLPTVPHGRDSRRGA